MKSEREIDESLRESGYNLSNRLALRTVIFDRPRLFPSTWDEARWEGFTRTHQGVIDATRKLIANETFDTDEASYE